MYKSILHTDHKRDRILFAALELFNEKGFDGTPVPLIAERASVATGTIYSYFRSKEALVNALFQQWKAELLKTMLEDIEEGMSVREKFFVVWNSMFDFARQNPKAFMFLENHYHGPYLDEESQSIEREFLNLISMAFEASIKEGLVKPLPIPALIAFVIGSFVGVFKEAASGRFELQAELVQNLGICCWEAIRA